MIQFSRFAPSHGVDWHGHDDGRNRWQPILSQYFCVISLNPWQYYSVSACMRYTFRSDGLNCWCGSALCSFTACALTFTSTVSCWASMFCNLQHSDRSYWSPSHQPQLSCVSIPTARSDDASYHTGCVPSRPYSHKNVPECYTAERGFQVVTGMSDVVKFWVQFWHLFHEDVHIAPGWDFVSSSWSQ